MALELNGSTGVSLVQDGVVTAADLASTLDLTGKTVTLPAGVGGKVLQVVSTQITAKTSTSVTTGGTFYDISGFSASITPSSASNKILVMAMVNQSYQTSGGQRQFLRILRDSTAIGIGDVAGSQYRTTTSFYRNDSNGQATMPLIWLDSPSTTSSTTYKIQVTSNTGSQTAYFNRDVNDNANDRAVTASQILLLEIAA